MGTFSQPITLISTTGDETETLDAIVDTGATFTAAPIAVLERLGVEAIRTVTLRLANGELERRRIGEVKARLNSVEHTIVCVFGEPGTPAVIGAVTLETFLLAIDPVAQRLVPVEGLWLQQLLAAEGK